VLPKLPKCSKCSLFASLLRAPQRSPSCAMSYTLEFKLLTVHLNRLLADFRAKVPNMPTAKCTDISLWSHQVPLVFVHSLSPGDVPNNMPAELPTESLPHYINLLCLYHGYCTNNLLEFLELLSAGNASKHLASGVAQRGGLLPPTGPV